MEKSLWGILGGAFFRLLLTVVPGPTVTGLKHKQ